MSNPVLFIVAGPNGSGKSLFSNRLTISELDVFDGDKHMAASRVSYAFETNFSSPDPMKTAREFNDAGYDLHLLFMGLNSLEESIQRVDYRVHRGGHKVSEESIRYNYEFGFKNLYKHITEFDLVTLFDNGITSIERPVKPREILHIEQGEVHLRTKDYPTWVEPVIARLTAL